MEWIALDARLEQKQNAKLRRQQRELKKQQKKLEAQQKELQKCEARCHEMYQEDLLSISLEVWYQKEAKRKQMELHRQEELQQHDTIAKARRRAKELGLLLSTAGATGAERLGMLEMRIYQKERRIEVAAMAKQRLDELPQKKGALKKLVQAFTISTLRKKIKHAVLEQQCDRLVRLLHPLPVSLSPEEKGQLLNYESKNGFTPVLAAIFTKKLSVLRKLLELGASPAFETRLGMTPLLAATLTDDLLTLDILMEFKIDLNYETKNGVKALLLAADKGRVSILKILLRSGADVNGTNNRGRTALMQAVIANQFEAARVLLAFGSNKTIEGSDGKTAMDWATLLKFSHLIALLNNPVTAATLYVQLEKEEEDDYGLNPFAALQHSKQKHILLLEQAMTGRNMVQIRQLLSVNDTVVSPNYEDSNGNTPFLVACSIGRCDDVLFCLERKCIPTHQNRHGATGLIAACYRGDMTVLNLLIRLGCNLLTCDFSGHDSYYYLNAYDHPDVAGVCTKQYRKLDTDAGPSLSLGDPLVTTESLRTQTHNSSSTSVHSQVPEPVDCTETDLSGGDFNDSNSSGEENAVHPRFNPFIRKWGTQQQILKHDRRRKNEFEDERTKILCAAQRGRRSGLIAPLPGDPAGRRKFPTCNNCKQSRARKRCFSCEQVLCDKCHARLHELAQRRHHEYEELVGEVFVKHESKEVVQARHTNSLQYSLEKSKECLTSMREVLLRDDTIGSTSFMMASTPADPEVEKYQRKLRLAKEKEIMQMQIHVPTAAAKHAFQAGEATIFSCPAELDLANLYIIQKKYNKAKEFLVQAQTIVEESLGMMHPTMLKISIGMAKIYQETGYPEKCVSTLQDALAIFESVLPVDNTDMVAALSLLLTFLQSQARFDEAVVVCRHFYHAHVNSLPQGDANTVAMQELLDQLVSKRETISMTKEDVIILERNRKDEQHREALIHDSKRRLEAFRHLLLEDPTGLDAFLAFARPEFVDVLINFWIAVEIFKKDGHTNQEFRAMAVQIYLMFIKSRRIKIITAAQRKKLKKTITTPGKKIAPTMYDEVQNVVFEVIYHGVYTRYMSSLQEISHQF